MELREKVNREIKSVIVPELRNLNFKGSFPHFRRIFDNGKVDYLSFQFNRYGGSFVIELAVAYPYEGKKGNFYYWDEVTPEFIKKSNYGYTNKRFRIEPRKGEWFEFDEQNYQQIVELALQLIMKHIGYFDKQHKFSSESDNTSSNLSGMLSKFVLKVKK